MSKFNIMGYSPDYNEICNYQNDFETYTHFKNLRETILKELEEKDKDEVLDIETKIKVELEEISKVSLGLSIFPLLVFVFGCISNVYKEMGELWYLAYSVIIVLTLGFIIFYINKCRRYNKYYVFYQDMIGRYKKENPGKF